MGEKVNNSESFGCTGCGAELKYSPGTSQLLCDYCGTTNDIPQLDTSIEELDFHAYLAQKEKNSEHITEYLIKCNSCGATTTIDPHITSANCAYCYTPLILSEAFDESILKPGSLLPFKLNNKEAKDSFKKWIKGLWFAPDSLQKAALNTDHFKGVYLPYWTYDTQTDTSYVGQRGEYYYVTESYVTTENGKSVTRTRQVQKTRWYPASGRVDHFFDNVLVVGSRSLPEKYVYQLEPWDLENLTAFDKAYLSGYQSEKYQIDLEQGFDVAKDIMDPQIRNMICRDIGGDTQRILTKSTNYKEVTFKHILLPVYVSAYRYNNKLYLFVVNARTGEVQGERPWSWIKITLLVVTILAAIGALIYLLGDN